MGGVDIKSVSVSDFIKIAAVILMAGVMYGKLDSISEQIKDSRVESKEFRMRIEKLELSVAELHLQYEQITLDDNKRERDFKH